MSDESREPTPAEPPDGSPTSTTESAAVDDGEASAEAEVLDRVRGLSPVVGTILMVLVTIVLASLIVTQVFGIGLPASESSPDVGIQRTISDAGLEVVVTSGSTDSLILMVNGSVEKRLTNVQVGDSVNLSDVGAGSHVSIVEETDGEEQVIHAETITSEEANTMGSNSSDDDGTFTTASTPSDVIGETGKFNISTKGANDWQTLTFRNTYEDPVVIIGPVSYNDNTSVDVRVKDVTGSSAQVKLEEWGYSKTNDADGLAHGKERTSYLVVESGKYTLYEGGEEENQIVAGTVSANTSWTTVDLRSQYPSLLDRQMRVFSQTQTYNEADAVSTRHRNVNNDTFDVKMQEQAVNTDGHATEQVGYVAGFENDTSDNFWIFQTTDNEASWFDESWFSPHADLYDESYVAFAQPQTYQGSDPIVVRYNGTMIVDNNYDEKLHEGPSTGEFNHVDEKVAGMAILNNYTIKKAD